MSAFFPTFFFVKDDQGYWVEGDFFGGSVPREELFGGVLEEIFFAEFYARELGGGFVQYGTRLARYDGAELEASPLVAIDFGYSESFLESQVGSDIAPLGAGRPFSMFFNTIGWWESGPFSFVAQIDDILVEEAEGGEQYGEGTPIDVSSFGAWGA